MGGAHSCRASLSAYLSCSEPHSRVSLSWATPRGCPQTAGLWQMLPAASRTPIDAAWVQVAGSTLVTRGSWMRRGTSHSPAGRQLGLSSHQEAVAVVLLGVGGWVGAAAARLTCPPAGVLAHTADPLLLLLPVLLLLLLQDQGTDQPRGGEDQPHRGGWPWGCSALLQWACDGPRCRGLGGRSWWLPEAAAVVAVLSRAWPRGPPAPPAQIDSALLASPAVAEAVSFGIPGGRGGHCWAGRS